jgi:outer membrane immunogenic protein
MIRKFAMATAVLMAAGASALAADLPSRRPPPPVFVPPPLFTWTGIYIGGDVGYTWGTDKHTSVIGASSVSPNGIIGGAHIGYNYQVNQFVFGIEGDVDGTNFNNSVTAGPLAAYVSTRIPIEGSARGRIGYAWDRALFFATGGAAFADIQHQYAIGGVFDPAGTYSKTRVGWTVGGGVEYALSNNWSVRAEYRYADFGHATDTTFVGLLPVDNHVVEHRVTVGFSYKFDMYAPPAPVVAKY